MLRHRALLSSAAGRRACSVLRPAKLHITSNESNYYEKEISCKIYRQAIMMLGVREYLTPPWWCQGWRNVECIRYWKPAFHPSINEHEIEGRLLQIKTIQLSAMHWTPSNFSDPLIEMLMVNWNFLSCTFLIINYYLKVPKDFSILSKGIKIAECRNVYWWVLGEQFALIKFRTRLSMHHLIKIIVS